MKKVLVIAVVALVAIASAATAATVVGTKHDLRRAGGPVSGTAEVCVFCHTPHQTAAAAAQDPLWNHQLSAQASYGVYGSTTMNAVPTDIGGATAGTAPVSNLCMSCHDGTIAVGALWNSPNDAVGALTYNAGNGVNATGMINTTALVGTSLVDDHPVNFTYNSALATADGGLVTPASASAVDAGGQVPLFAATVQCASCHDPHDNTNTPFLVVSNSASALCTTCHTK